MRKKLQLSGDLFLLTLLALALSICATRSTMGADKFTGPEFQLRRPGKTFQSKVLGQPLEVPPGMAYQFDVWIDPVVRPEGNMQVDPGFAFNLSSAKAEPNPYRDSAPKIAVSVREASDRGFWSVFIDGVNVSANPPDKGNHNNGELQKPFVFAARPGAYHLRVVGVPEANQTRLRFYFEDMFRPAEEDLVPRTVLPGHHLLRRLRHA